MNCAFLLLVLILPATAAAALRVEKTDPVGRKVENEFYVADLSHRTIQGKEEDSGTIRALTYKPFGVTLLRTRNRMHWAPNLQREGASGYKGIGTWHPVQTFRDEEIKDESYVHFREGHLADYPEVKIEAEYRFLAGVPYFLFRSRMTVEKPFPAVLVRNNEMTMDSFFTHVAWPTKDGRRHLSTFDDRKPLIEKDPIAVDAPWVAFVNLDKGYGYGFVKLDYSATKTRNAAIGISDGADNGKYWSRVIISREPTPIGPGDVFEERTAYVLFRCSKEKPLDEFFDWEKKIRARFGGAKAAVAPSRFPELGVVPRQGGFRMDGYWVWCGSVIKGDDGRYHMFASRWPKDIIFHPGWMTNSEIVRAVADKPEGPYKFQQVVLPARGAEYWDGRATHNPSITRHGGTYILYYMGSTHPFDDPPRGKLFPLSDPRAIVGRSHKRIGIATSTSLEGPWTRSDRPALDTKPGTFYSFLTSNPSPVVHEDGSALLVFKSRRYEGVPHSRMMLGVARAKHYLGPYEVVGDEPIFSANRFGEVEDPFVWKSPAGYEMIAKDMTGTLVGEKHAGVHAVSKDGVKWDLAPHPKAWTRKLRWDDGTSQTMGQLERPFLLIENGRPVFLFAATGDGAGGFDKMTESFNVAIPLVSR